MVLTFSCTQSFSQRVIACLLLIIWHVVAQSAMKTQRIGSNQEAADKQYWNAAATKVENLGWVMFAQRTDCFWASCGLVGQKVVPVVAYLGQEQHPEANEFDHWREVTVDTSHMDYMLNTSAGDHFLLMDFRPYLWHSLLYVAHSARIMNWHEGQFTASLEHMAFSQFEHEQNTLVLRHIFPLDVVDGPKKQKNWGFLERGNHKLVLYSAFPCIRLLDYSIRHKGMLRSHAQHCYHDMHGVIQKSAGFDINDSRISAHPIIWNSPEGHQEYLIIAHNSMTAGVSDYNHWLIRANPETFQITHISRGAIYGARFFAVNGAFPGAIIVGSVHVFDILGRPQLYILGGEGDAFCIFHQLDLESVMWLEVKPDDDLS